jgi:hypothetical protein
MKNELFVTVMKMMMMMMRMPPTFHSSRATSYKSSAAAAELMPLELESLPGNGQVAPYKSETAVFLKQREYQRLETLAGKTEAKAAISGQRGIASDYGGI